MFGKKKSSTTTAKSESFQPSSNGDDLQTTVERLNFEKGKYEHSKASNIIMSGLNTGVGLADSNPLTSVTSVLSALPSQIGNNPIIDGAMQVLDQLSDLGKTLPFVAPAFVVLKIIIDIEKKAREADAKCNDLLERITFMLSHLSVLTRIQVMDATRRVIEQMNGVLKTSASLIQAYRKQGAVARRLNMGNKDKFVSCADSISKCSNDLMISLQIQQTGQLDILTRSVPIDPEDEAAQIFLNSHGGPDTVKSNKQLVAQFAQQQHLSIDDESMTEINTNISNLMQQNQAQLERVLSANVGAAVIDGIKGLAAQMNETEREHVFTCVQCGKEFRTSTNGPKSCGFHIAEFDSWNKSQPCCGAKSANSNPCMFSTHRAVHHCEYPYAPFFERVRNILSYVDTHEEWAGVKDTNLEDEHVVKASLLRLIRWKSHGDVIQEPTILITVGRVWHSDPYFFDTFTVKQLAAVATAINASGDYVIFRTDHSDSEFAMAEWVPSESDGSIVGVRLTAKAASSEVPYVKLCLIDSTTLAKGNVITVSEGGQRSYKPNTPYILPETVRVGPELSDNPLRAVRTDFKTQTTPALPVLLKVASDPPLKANAEFASTTRDSFEGSITIFNRQPVGSPMPLTITSLSASFRLLGDTEYTPVESIAIISASPQLPTTIEPRQSVTLKFQAHVPRIEEDVKIDIRWWNRAFVSRHRPLRLKVIFNDIEDQECSLLMEHIYKPFSLEKTKPDDLGFFFFDDFPLCVRHAISVRPSSQANDVVSIGGRAITVTHLQKVVYKALKDGVSEVDLEIGEDKNGVWDWKAWALVDLSCRRVYAFKVILKQGNKASVNAFGTLGYVLCPDYGDVLDVTRPIQYAKEVAKLPKLGPFSAKVVAEDGLDDIVPDPPKPVPAPIPVLPAATSASVSQGSLLASESLDQRLASIDSNLSSLNSNLARIAVALEQLVAAKTK